MERRVLGGLAATFALAGSTAFAAGAAPESFILPRNDWVPNNPHLPVLLYKGAVLSKDPAAYEALFQKNDWPPQWRNGVYSFHHFHSTAHEILGFADGEADIMLGGPNGRVVHVQGGDVAVLPAGTGHCLISSKGNFLVIGAYPPDQHWDIMRHAISAEAVQKMDALPFPKSDPVYGAAGPLTTLWKA